MRCGRAASLAAESRPGYDRTSRANVVRHPGKGRGMMDGFAPRVTSPEVESMIESMRAMQAKDIAAFEQKVTA